MSGFYVQKKAFGDTIGTVNFLISHCFFEGRIEY